ncbi:MAG TPA: hypothetical protein HPP66_11895 [Planctomycetes bacterium]|nr:hypothetical protein [Planctomycetota bacterium]
MLSPNLPIVLIDGVRYQLITPEREAWLEKAIQSNSKHIFGPDSFYFDIKKMIRSKAGVASIPDGYVIFFTPKPRWAIVEVELASHRVYDHVIPQLIKFNKGIADSSTRRKLVEILYYVFDDNEVLKARLKQKIKTGEVYKFISDLVSEKPLIVVVIDQKTEELNEALDDIKGEVQVVEFKTFRREGLSGDVNAFVFEPVETKAIIIPDPPPKGIMHSVFKLFDKKCVDNVTYHECESIAREVKPDTKFNKSHFSWYKREYKKRREGRGTDRFGSRLGSNQAKINAVLSTEPKTMKTLVEEAGFSSTYYGHLGRLIEKGFVEKTDRGFRKIVGSKTVIEPQPNKYSEFWAPMRKDGLFKGKPVPVRDEGWIAKGIKGVTLILHLRNHKCSILLSLKGPDRKDRRDKVAKLFPKTKYEYEVRESPKFATIEFPVLDKGKKDREHWPEIRENLTKLGADIYNKIKESDI